MPRQPSSPDPACAVSAAAAVLADRWCWLVVRDVARGHRRFDDLVAELGISRKVLADRLRHLVDAGVLERVAYTSAPPRHDYLLTARGRALLPVLVGLQDWGDRWVLGDGEVTATSTHADHERVHALVGTVVPALRLPATAGDGAVVDGPTVLFAYPATGTPSPLPDGWSDVPGAAGCTLENRLFRDRYGEFRAAKVAVHGVSTQRPEEQRAFAEAEAIPFPLLSDSALELAAALRLPTVRVADTVRLRRSLFVIDADRRIRAVRYPVLDIADAIDWALSRAG
ncbi:transcriptional regulator, HxlR family [Micromonospora pattaloongensis]|uniref:Transcriptional regulator, HxlR family n=1 Tax=Micromonospora pattaloongensis TaxID=405436 RepID=A0A1H3JIJ1_9ACTN|nr:winged helix-turn-helix transcriptional regulator [Micromonospora pattaloongensis]SDY39732.1 transcriptional regulator, HxlR family [Micromonospora pattaloongensis]